MAYYKYTILDRLKKLSVYDYEQALKFFPERLSITKQTFRNWIYIRGDAKEVIPVTCLYQIALFFECDPIDLFSNWTEDKQELMTAWEEFKEKQFKISAKHVQD